MVAIECLDAVSVDAGGVDQLQQVMDNLPSPDVIARGIVEDLTAARAWTLTTFIVMSVLALAAGA